MWRLQEGAIILGLLLLLAVAVAVAVALGVVFGKWIGSRPQRRKLLSLLLLLVSWESLLPTKLPAGEAANRGRYGYCWMILRKIDLLLLLIGIHGPRTKYLDDSRLLRSRTNDDDLQRW